MRYEDFTATVARILKADFPDCPAGVSVAASVLEFSGPLATVRLLPVRRHDVLMHVLPAGENASATEYPISARTAREVAVRIALLLQGERA